MKTEIFDSFAAFQKRKDKRINGVSRQFVEDYPNYSVENITNFGCWCCYKCTQCINCIFCIDCINCSGCSNSARCELCLSCKDCLSCILCDNCDCCTSCKQLDTCKFSFQQKMGKELNLKISENWEIIDGITIPIIDNFHQKIFDGFNNLLHPFKGFEFDGDIYYDNHTYADWIVSITLGVDILANSSPYLIAQLINLRSSKLIIPMIYLCQEDYLISDKIKEFALMEVKFG